MDLFWRLVGFVKVLVPQKWPAVGRRRIFYEKELLSTKVEGVDIFDR